MLTIKQPVHYGYKSVHDLPTPPSTSRPSPPLIFQEPQKPLPAIPRSHSPSNQPMSGHHRGLPPPAAMALPQPPPGPGSHPPPPPGPGPGQVPPPPASASQAQQLGQLPAPPQWQGSEESMRAWLLAKAEEEKRKQEELRLEQRRMEHDILRTSLQGGIPPPMVPVVFAGMGGGNLPQAALEWAQQFMYSQAQQTQHPQLLPPAGPVSPHHRRDSQTQPYGHYPGSGGVPSTPGSAQGPQGGFVAGYPGSPTRARGYSLPPGGRPLGGSNLPTLNTNVPPGPAGPSAGHSHPGIASAQPERQASPPIYFHHWQPPTSQAGQGSSNQPATPSAIGESPRKRKATGPQQAAPPPSSHQRFRSPPFSHSGSTLSNPPPGRRRGHSRQRSDLSSYRPSGRGRSEGFGGPQRGASPLPGSGPSSAREGNGSSGAEAISSQPQPPPPSLSQTRSGAHSVSSLLSEDPSPQTPQYPRVSSSSDVRAHQAVDSDQRNSPHSSDDRTRGGAAGSATTRERDNE